jgi:hypothetical protein
MPVDISGRPYSIAEAHHHTAAYFNSHIAARILGAGQVNWTNVSAQQSCAMRLSIALAYAGVHWSRVSNSWRLQGTNVYFPSLASDYPNLLANREQISSPTDVSGRRGVVFFGGGSASASGHVALWNCSNCHYNDAHWGQPDEYFWQTA